MVRKKKSRIQVLRSEADNLFREAVFKKWGKKCEAVDCKNTATTAHHLFPKGLYGHLRYNLDNGMPICFKCHFKHHHRGDPMIHQSVVEKRGGEWYRKLLEASKDRPPGFRTAGYYEENIKRLKDYLLN